MISYEDSKSTTKIYLERLKELRESGHSEDSEAIQNLYQEIQELPSESNQRLLSILEMRGSMIKGLKLTLQEMSPREVEPEFFVERFKNLSERFSKNNSSEH